MHSLYWIWKEGIERIYIHYEWARPVILAGLPQCKNQAKCNIYNKIKLLLLSGRRKGRDV